MGFAVITFDERQSLKDIQDKFRKNLNSKEILKTTARALNEVAKKVQGHIRQQIRKEYTVKNAYLMKMSYISKMAKGEQGSLYANVKFSYKPVPMIGFKHTGTVKSKRPVTVTIKKGQTKVFRHAWIGLKKVKGKDEVSEREAVYANGKYKGGRFVPNIGVKGKKSISELKTASPYTMAFNRNIQPKIIEYTRRELPAKLEVFLQKKLEYIAKETRRSQRKSVNIR